MVFRHGNQNIEHLTGDQPKIACIPWYVNFGDMTQDAVEEIRGGSLEKTFTRAFSALSINHVGAVIHQSHHFG